MEKLNVISTIDKINYMFGNCYIGCDLKDCEHKMIECSGKIYSFVSNQRCCCIAIVKI